MECAKLRDASQFAPSGWEKAGVTLDHRTNLLQQVKDGGSIGGVLFAKNLVGNTATNVKLQNSAQRGLEKAKKQREQIRLKKEQQKLEQQKKEEEEKREKAQQ